MMRLLLILVFVAQVVSRAAAAPDWREMWTAESYARWRAVPTAELRKKADAGDAVAMLYLSHRLRGENKHEEATEWRAKAAKAGMPQAITDELWGMQQNDLKTYVEQLEKAAATGYPMAKVYLARVLVAGAVDKKVFIVKADPGRAVQLLQEAADQNAIEAWATLASLYASGTGEPRNDGERPLMLWAKAANNNDSDAMFEMARRRRVGLGVEKDLISSAGWAMRGYMIGMRRFAGGQAPQPQDWLRFLHGEDVEILRKLTRLYEQGLLQGSRAALIELAELNVKSDWGKPNLPRAAALYRLAAKVGDASGTAKAAGIESKLDKEELATMQRDLAWMSISE